MMVMVVMMVMMMVMVVMVMMVTMLTIGHLVTACPCGCRTCRRSGFGSALTLISLILGTQEVVQDVNDRGNVSLRLAIGILESRIKGSWK